MQNSAFEINHFRKNKALRVGSKLISLERPLVMGIMNLTPDSFYSGSRISNTEEFLEKAKKMIQDGVDIVDIGGYSTRPGAKEISVEEELSRVIPAISVLRNQFPELLISIDTFRSNVAEVAIKAGANMINDVSGFSIDPKIAKIAGNYRVPYVLMHMRGTPETMQKLTDYDNIFSEIMSYFSSKINTLHEHGVHDIIIDPGFGFSKNIEQNFHLMKNLESFHMLDLPLMVGISRKSMIYKKLGVEPQDSLHGTIALNAIALSKGASILRVHDVLEARQLINLLH